MLTYINMVCVCTGPERIEGNDYVAVFECEGSNGSVSQVPIITTDIHDDGIQLYGHRVMLDCEFVKGNLARELCRAILRARTIAILDLK